MKRINWVRWLVLACTIGILGSMSLIPRLVAAQGPTPEMWTTGPNGEQIPWNTPGGAQPSGPAQTTPVPGGDPGGGWQLPDVVGTITQIIRHILVFPAKSLQETLEQAVAATLKDNVEYMRHPLEEALYLTIFSTPTLRGTPTAAGQGFAGLWVGTNPFEDVWYKVRLVSFFLYPILLAITGLSITSRNALGASWQGEDLGEALVRWFFIVLASGLSLYLCDWINRLCNALAGLFLGMPDATFIVNAVFMGASSVLIVGGGPVLGLLLGVFMFVVGLLIIVALIMQYVARYVLLYILVAIAPLAILALGLDQTRWLGFLWIKGFLMVTLLQPISALVFALMYLLAQNGVLNGLADPVGSFVKFAVVVGLLSVLITLNYAVINGVFGAIGQVMAQGKNTAMGVASLMGRTLTVGLTAVAGIAGGGAVAGGGGAAAMTGSGGGAATGGGGGIAAGGGGPASGGMAAQTGQSTGGEAGATDLAGGVQGLGRQGLGRALEMVGSGLGFGGRSQVGRTVGGLMRSGGIQMQRDADEGRRQRTQADRDTQRGQELTTRERHGEYQGYARQMTGDPKTQRDVVAAMDILSETWGHQRVREALPAVTHAMGLATGRGGAAGEGGGRTSLPRLAEERGYVNPAGQPLPQHFVASEVERELIGRHGAQGAPQFSPPQAGRVAPGQAPPSRPGIVPGLGQHSPPDYFDYREGGTRIAEALGVGTEREAVRVYGNLYSSLRQDAPLRNTAAATDPRDDRLALANGLVAEAPRIATQARTAGADVQAAFVQHVDGLAAQHGLTGADLGDTWVQHAARFRTT